MSLVYVRYEQAVYGSFPFWDKGYAILARSPGCRDEWIADLRATCQRYGERPAGAAEAGGLISLKLPSGPWAIIAPSAQGLDDRGRPGAVAFHAIFVSGPDYRKTGAFPFAFTSLFRSDWSSETTSLQGGRLVLDQAPGSTGIPSENPQVRRIAEALMRRKRVALEVAAPIDDLAREVYLALPLSRRAKISLATWSFAIGNRFDIVALPRLSGVVLDPSYVDPAFFYEDPSLPENKAQPKRIKNLRVWMIAGLIVCIVFLSLFFFPGSVRKRGSTLERPENPVPSVLAQSSELSTVTRLRVQEGVIGLAERFGVLDANLSAGDLKPDALMLRLRDELTYRGPFLGNDQIAQLAKTSDGQRLLAWHDHLSHFLADRPLPTDFSTGKLDWQLRVLAWSFHFDVENRRIEELPGFLSEALSVPFTIRSSGLESLDPTWGDYAKFLRKLPRR